MKSTVYHLPTLVHVKNRKTAIEPKKHYAHYAIAISFYQKFRFSKFKLNVYVPESNNCGFVAVLIHRCEHRRT